MAAVLSELRDSPHPCHSLGCRPAARQAAAMHSRYTASTRYSLTRETGACCSYHDQLELPQSHFKAMDSAVYLALSQNAGAVLVATIYMPSKSIQICCGPTVHSTHMPIQPGNSPVTACKAKFVPAERPNCSTCHFACSLKTTCCAAWDAIHLVFPCAAPSLSLPACKSLHSGGRPH